MPRSPEDYGIYDLEDWQLQELASNAKRYGEKSRFASRELAGRRGVISEADTYRAALERAAYGDAGAQYGAGLRQVSSYLAGAGPMSDSGGANALRSRLYSDIYGRARSRIGSGYADYLGRALAGRRGYRYQRALAELAAKKKKSPWGAIGGAIGGIGGALIGGPPGAMAGASVGSTVGGSAGGSAETWGWD